MTTSSKLSSTWPTASRLTGSRLRVVQPAAPRQDCSRCRVMSHCWKPVISERAVLINLLVCRLQRKIEVNKSTKLLLTLLRPKLRQTALSLVKTLSAENTEDEVILDLSAFVIEQLMSKYTVGEHMHPLRWLFNRPNGAVTRWSTRYRRAAYKRQRHEVLTESGTLDNETVPGHEYDPDAATYERNTRALQLIRDGVTFPLNEYRVLRFFLRNADNRPGMPHYGLPRRLSATSGRPAKQLVRTYASAARRLLDWTGAAPAFLGAHGLVIPDTAVERRTRRLMHEDAQKSNEDALTASEIFKVLSIRYNTRASVPELAWCYGISEYTLYRLQQRFRGLSLSEIRAILYT